MLNDIPTVIWVLLLSLGVVLVAILLFTLYRAASRLRKITITSSTLPTIVSALVVLWFVSAFVLGATGVYAQDVGPLPAFLFGLLIPVLIGAGLLVFSNTFRALLHQVSPVGIIAVQFYRVAGLVFLILLARDQLPGIFAYPAGIGDILTGILAPIVAYAYARNYAWSTGAVKAWNTFGIADLVNAVVIGRLASGVLNVMPTTAIVGLFPLVLIPTFFVPLGILLHIFSFYALLRTKSVGNDVTATSSQIQEVTS